MCSLERHGRVFVLKLLGENEHWLNSHLLSQLLDSINTVQLCPDAAALVMTNEGRFFSNGLDLEWMRQDPDTRAPLLLNHLEKVVSALMRLNVPTIAAVCGHAAAGGLLLAMAHDHRMMRSDRGFLYCSAVDIGFVIPKGSIALLKAKLHANTFKDVVLKGTKYTGIMALATGLVDSVHPDSDATIEAAVEEANRLGNRGWKKDAYVALRLSMYDDVLGVLENDDTHSDGGFV